MRKLTSFASVAVLVFLGIGASLAYANHSWSGYHWGRTANPFTLELGDNVSTTWDAYLATASADWSASAVLDTAIKPGKARPRTCKATNGRVEVCSERYGNNGWLGIAQIWVNGTHITKGTVKVNDTYFNTRTYNTSAWRNLVMCQEVGHTLGLDHQDENFDNPNLGTCMDYTSDPSTNQHPNQHDYDMLEEIYAHLDSINTLVNTFTVTAGETLGTPGTKRQARSDVQETEFDLEDPSSWGREVKWDARGNRSLYVRDLGNSEKVFTFVTWVQ